MIPARRFPAPFARLAPIVVAAALFVLAPRSALAVGLPDALATAGERTAVVTAELDLNDARRALERTEADPTALRLDLLQAEQALATARTELRSARFAAYAEIVDAYVQALEARAGVELAEAGVDLAARGREIATIRRDRGAATELDVRDAETELASARSDLQTARQGAALAARSLISLTGLEVAALEPVPSSWLELDTPGLATLLSRIDETPSMQQAMQALVLARTARDLLDPAYAPLRDIEAADLRIAQAREGVDEARRGIELLLRSGFDRVASARDALAVARESLANAEDRERIDRSRLSSGLIAEIQYDRTKLATLQAANGLQRAEHEVLRSLFALQADSGLAIEGIDAF